MEGKGRRDQGRDFLGNMKTTGERKGRDRNKGGTSYSVLEDEKTEQSKIRKWLRQFQPNRLENAI